ncbi:MAG: ABC-2 transporter permease [Coriobacteriales bacterium]|jgi:hypothetical protein|nr:ABC-2 transporter permease [Coriobacteriales bacterium]
MLGLLRKDMLLARKALSWVYLFPVVLMIVSLFGAPAIMAMSLAIVIFFLANSLVYSVFEADSKYWWENTIWSLPLRASQVVGARFLFSLILLAALLLVVIVFEVAIAFFFDISAPLIFATVFGSLASTLMYSAIVFPIVYRYGPAKMQLATIIYIVLVLLFGFSVMKFIPTDAISMLLSDIWLMPVVSLGALVFAVVCLLVSYFVSLKMVEKEHARR